MKSLEFSRLKSIISTFSQAKVLVIGDLILDEFIWGKVTRISPEAPVPVVWVDSENFMPGGASNVASNIRSLGGQVFLAGVVGEDSRAEILRRELQKKGKIISEGKDKNLTNSQGKQYSFAREEDLSTWTKKAHKNPKEDIYCVKITKKL